MSRTWSGPSRGAPPRSSPAAAARRSSSQRQEPAVAAVGRGAVSATGVLALQRTVGNRAVLSWLDRRGPPAVQRAVDATAARERNPHFARAEPVILAAIAEANGDLWKMINDPAMKVDLVFRADLGTFTQATGLAQPMAFYDDPARRARIEDLMAEGVDLKEETITLELQVVPPVLSFWQRTAGNAAGTIAHEYAIHAERYARTIRHIREEGSVGPAAVHTLNEFADAGDYDPDVHHASVFQDDEHHARYAELVDHMRRQFLAAGMDREAGRVVREFEEDVREHRQQARFTAWRGRMAERLGRFRQRLPRRFRRLN